MHSIVLVVVHLGEASMQRVNSSSMSSIVKGKRLEKLKTCGVECVIIKRPLKDGSMDC